ncbi:MAG: hypothetical protein J5J06_05460 [Phycisphaerae bacterium]|nr:hypothetical protein [Phycisphaerae bacterium]
MLFELLVSIALVLTGIGFVVIGVLLHRLRRSLRWCEVLNPLLQPWPPEIETRIVNLGPRVGKVVQYRHGFDFTKLLKDKEVLS